MENAWPGNQLFRYIEIPWVLCEDEQYKSLSLESIALYGILLQRAQLSKKNGWIDIENGQVYIYYTKENLEKICHCGYQRVKRMMDELENANLLTQKRQGLCKPNKLYVHPFSTENDYFSSRSSENPNSGDAIFPIQDTEESNASNNNFSNKIDRYDVMQSRIKEAIEYDYLIQYNDKCIIDEIVCLMEDTMGDMSETICIGKRQYPREQVINRFKMLDASHIEYVLERMKESGETIRNIRAYLLTALYNAPSTIETFYTDDAKKTI